MSSISLYMATVMFGSDWLDVTNGGSKQLIFPMAKGTPMQDGNARRAISEDPC